MARFAVGQSIGTREPFILVDPGLRPGRHSFQLVVVTGDGRASPPDAVTVTVTDRTVTPVGTITGGTSDRTTTPRTPIRAVDRGFAEDVIRE